MRAEEAAGGRREPQGSTRHASFIVHEITCPEGDPERLARGVEDMFPFETRPRELAATCHCWRDFLLIAHPPRRRVASTASGPART